MQQTRDLIVRLLRSLGTRKEVEQYLKQYSEAPSQKFAVTKVSGDILAKDLDALVSSLTFLHRVGLSPIVVHGARSPQDDAEESERKAVLRENLRLVEALEEMGTRARPITTGVFEANEGAEGEAPTVTLDAIHSTLRAGQLPIVAALGETSAGQTVQVDPDDAADAVALSIEPHKMIVLTGAGGVLDGHGGIVSAINLAEDYDRLLREPWLDDQTRARLPRIKALLDKLPASSSVSITSPDRLAKELFTHTGSGTLVRRGERVVRYESMDGIDTDRVAALLEACFGRDLDPGYFAKKAFYRVYLADSYRATAILTRHGEIPYLDKFAVTTEAQGAGVGGSIWTRMKSENDKLFWRAKSENEINPWYFQQAEGSFKSGKWTVFWYGLEGFDAIKACVEHALALPATLREHGRGDVSS